jgi:NAD(P)-dependent dehydrogenase (short-subunit alcohol dehydrogenase family)
MHDFDLTGRAIWVIGGAGYLGQSVTRLLSQMGARVLCADLEGRAAAFVSSESSLANVTAATCDLADIAATARWVEQQCHDEGSPEGVAVLTYASTAKKLDDLSEEDFDRASHGNLTATFFFAREVARRMAAAGGGSIALFSSMYGTVAPDPSIYEPPMNANPVEYGVGKAGIQQMARYLAVHYGRHAVRVNSISPGPFPNPVSQRENPAFIERLSKKVPLGRVGQASEIAGSVAFLLSDAATYITGHNLAVDGGWTAW